MRSPYRTTEARPADPSYGRLVVELSAALADLPETYGTALRLQMAGATEDAIAAQLGVEREAVGPLLRMARAKLVTLLSTDSPA